MFVRLTRRKRAKAGWLVALLYLFCVLAPGAALALGDPAHCLPAQTEQAAAAMHDHSGHGAAPAHHADASDVAHTHDGKTTDGKTSPGPCCAMLCVSAIAADLPSVARPTQPIAVRVGHNEQRLHGEPPALLYRPPIA